MHRSLATVRVCKAVLFALVLALPALAGCVAPEASGPKAASGNGAASATRADAALGTATQVDHFLSATPLLTKVGPDVADQYRKAMEKQKEVAGLHALVASEQGGLDRASSADDKAKGAQRLLDLKKMAEAGEKTESVLEQRLVTTAKDRSRRATPRVRATLGPFLSNLRHSVADAREVSGREAVGSAELLSLEATVLDAVLDGFTKAGWNPDAGSKVATGSEPARAPRHVGRRLRGTDQAVASAKTDPAPKGASSAGSQEVFAP